MEFHNCFDPNQESVAGSVIQASETVESEDGSRIVIALGDCCCHHGDFVKPRINSITLLGFMLVLGVV